MTYRYKAHAWRRCGETLADDPWTPSMPTWRTVCGVQSFPIASETTPDTRRVTCAHCLRNGAVRDYTEGR